MTTKKAAPSWTSVKARLADLDHTSLLGLVQDLYAASKDNQAFLHTRLRPGGDVLEPYKAAIDRWLWPDVFKNQDTSVAKAKKVPGLVPSEQLSAGQEASAGVANGLGP